MKKRILVVLVATYFTLLFGVSSKSFCSFEHVAIGARYCAMGKTAVGFIDTPEAIYMNPAGLALNHDLSFSAFCAHPFGLKEIFSGAVMLQVPMGRTVFGCGVKTIGNKQYNEKQSSVSIAHPLGEHWLAGVTINLSRLEIVRYGDDSVVDCDIGMILRIRPNFSYGFFARNVTGSRIGGRDESIPQVLVTGFNYWPANDTNINLDIYKDVIYPLELRCGVEYVPLSYVGFRLGFQTCLNIVSGGFGIRSDYIDIDYSIETHPYLSVTHQFSVRLKLK